MKKRFTILGLALMFALLLAACGPSGATPDENGELLVIQIDEEGGMRFEPSDIQLTAGQTVRIILENHGDKDHEFMVGRDLMRGDDGAAIGFAVDFFEGFEDQVTVDLGDGAMLMIDAETIAMGGEGMDMGDGDMDMGDEEDMDMGDDEDMDMEEGDHEDEHEEDDHGMDHSGWMVMNNAGSGTTFIEFTVPADRVGEWQIGCFEDDGTHFDDGMNGTLVVVAP